MSECRILRALFPNAEIGRRNASCDSCHGQIGGPRLFCLDCSIKSKNLFNTLDLCNAPQCVGARVTHREDLEEAHEPTHRLVKVRTALLSRSHGRVHTAACDAFERVEETCRKIAGSPLPSDGTEPNGQKTSSFGLISTEMPAKMPVGNDKSDDVLNTPDNTKGGAEVEGETARGGSQDQVQDESLPACGKCSARLSFPFWYCIFCEGWSRGKYASPCALIVRAVLLDNLYICDACDADGVPDLTRSSGKHTEEHHLIRCLALEEMDEKDKASATEYRLTLIEGRLDGLQTQLDGLTGHMGDLTGRVGDLTGRTGDLTTRIGDLTGYIGDLNTRIGNIEQLLHRLVRASEGRVV